MLSGLWDLLFLRENACDVSAQNFVEASLRNIAKSELASSLLQMHILKVASIPNGRGNIFEIRVESPPCRSKSPKSLNPGTPSSGNGFYRQLLDYFQCHSLYQRLEDLICQFSFQRTLIFQRKFERVLVETS